MNMYVNGILLILYIVGMSGIMVLILLMVGIDDYAKNKKKNKKNKDKYKESSTK